MTQHYQQVNPIMHFNKYLCFSWTLTSLIFTSLVSNGLAVEPDADQWPEFRNGGSSITVGQLPSVWNPESIAWQRELTGYGQSSPVIYRGRVFVTSVAGL